MRQKSPELEIPEGVFYDQIPGYNLYVRHKDRERGKLHDIMIYDVSRGGDNASVITADSALMAMTRDMKHIYLHLWNGEQFENLRDQSATNNSYQNVPFRRESFEDKEVLIPFDANFNRMDEEGMRRQYVGKNIAQLRHTMDSVGSRIDSIGVIYKRDIEATSFPTVTGQQRDEKKALAKVPAVRLDTLLARMNGEQRMELYGSALNISKRKQGELEFRAMTMADEKKTFRRHEIELIKKFTLSVACLIFFFIGAPLGAIIRKGGLGTPLVISVILFLVYYIIDNTGYKMARDGHIVVWMGMWLSTFILAPLGIYVTWKAMNDSSVFDRDRYLDFFRRISGARQHRVVLNKEVIINDISTPEALRRLENLIAETRRERRRIGGRLAYRTYWLKGIGARGLAGLSENLEATVAYLNDSRNLLVVNRLTDYPVLRKLWIYRPSEKRWLSMLMMILVPVGFPIYLYALRCRRNLRTELDGIISRSRGIIELLAAESQKQD